jgi:hypothetical protein
MKMENMLKVVILGILTIVISMQLILGTNQTGWDAGLINMVNVIIPLVLGVAVVLVVLSIALGTGRKVL